MGYLDTPEKKQAAAAHIGKLGKDLGLIRPSLVLTDDSINTLAKWAWLHLDQQGTLDIYEFAKMADDPRLNIPHLSLFPECTTVEKATEYVRKNSRKIPATQTGKLNELLAHLQKHSIHDDTTSSAPAAPAKPLTEKEKAAANLKTEIDAIKAEIDAATKGYTQWAINQRKKLHARFAELLADMPRAKFFDRYGSQEWLTGWPAVQRLIREEIHTVENGSIR